MKKEITIKDITPKCSRCIRSVYAQEKRTNLLKGVYLFCNEDHCRVSEDGSCEKFKISNVLASYFDGTLKGTHKRTIRDILQLRMDNGTI